jgi:hypothetical protein
VSFLIYIVGQPFLALVEAKLFETLITESLLLMHSKSHNSQRYSGKPVERWSGGVSMGATILVGLAATAYVSWFLSYPVLAGWLGADGEAMSRLLFLSRVMLPELWWNEMTGGGRFPLGIGDRWPVAFGVVAWLGIAFAVGRPCVRIGLRNVTQVEAVALAMLAGLALLSTATLLVGLAGGSSSRWGIGLAVAAMLAGAGFANWRLGKEHDQDDPDSDTKGLVIEPVKWLPAEVAPAGVFGQWAGRWVVVLTIVLAVIYALGALMPPFEFDVVEYHLQSAKEFYQLGYIGFNDHNIYVNMPLGLEMHSLAAMSLVGGANVNDPDGWWLGGLIGKAIIGAHSLIAALLIGGFVARKTDSRWIGWSAAGLWLSIPGNAHVATSGLIDAALSTYILAGLVAVTELWPRLAGPTEGAASRNSKWLVLLIFFYEGGGDAAKYPGLIYAVLPCFAAVGAALYGVPKAGRMEVAKQWILPTVCGLSLTCVPWFVKNAVLTGNPVYPLGYSLFGGKGLDAQHALQWSKAHRVPVDAQTGSAYSISALVSSAKQIVVASEFAQPCVMILAVFGLLGPLVFRDAERGRKRLWFSSWIGGWLACSAWILLVWWLATHRIDRFWLPAVSIWAAVAGFGLAWLVTKVSHGLATVLMLFGLVYGIVINASPAVGDNRYFVSLAALRSDGGDGETVGRVSRPIAWCNENLPPKISKLLLVGEARAFDFRMPIVYSTCFDISPVESWLRGKTVEEQRANLWSAGATHLLVNWTEITRYRGPGNYGFSDWPSREDLEKLVESGVIRRVSWPIALESAELFEVVAAAESGE